MASHGQTQFQGHVPNQSQNVGQQRQVPIGQQQFQGQQQPKGNQLQTQQQALYNSYDPQLALFTLEKPKGAKNWEDAAPEQQHVTLQDIQNELTKFRRKRGNVAQALREITSSNCRRIINELVTSETEELWKYNKSIQFRIASINIDWEKISRSSRQIKRVEVILETEPSRFQEPVQMKPMAGMNPAFAQEAPKGPKQGPGPQMQPGQVPHMPQGPKPNAVPHMAHGHPQPQGVSAQNAPPPPPPPGHGGHAGGPISGAPPPPPPGPGHNMHGAPMPKAGPHGRGAMPGAFPEPMVMPMPSMGRGHGVQPHIMDRGMLKKQKKGKHHHGSISSASSSSSTSSASDWESDSDSSSSGPVRVSHVEQGDYNLVDRRDPSRHSKKHRKSHKHRSDSRMRSRSRSRSVPRLGRSGHIDMSSRKRRDSAMIDPPPMGRHSGYSSKASSPRLAHSQLHGQPQQVHIHVNTNNSSDEKEHDPERPRLRQSSMSSPSASFFKDKRKLEKLDTALPMSRESSASWERGSGTASWTNSSAYAPDDIVFDKPERRPSLNRGHSRTQSYPYPHDSHIYDDVDLQHRSNIQRVRHLPADDYPHNHRSYFSERPLPHRRGSAQATSVNPFATPHYPPKPHRSMSYAAEAHEPYTAFPQQRYLTEHSDREDTFDMQDMVEALKHVKESRRASAAPALQRRATVGREDFYTRDEEWDARYGGNAMRYGRYV